MLQSTLRRTLRRIGVAFPQLMRYSGRLGLGRLLTRGQSLEQVVIDQDVVIELDLSVPFYRALYFHFDLSVAEETLLLRRLLKPQATFVDVGAHIGYVALVAAKYAGRVLAIEPGPTTFRRLTRNIQLNPRLAGKMTALPIALSTAPGTLALLDSDLQPNRVSFAYRVPDSRETEVEVRTLDDVAASYLDRVDFLKVDVEGAELDVLQGGRATLERDQPLVLCELCEDTQVAFGRTCRDILRFFDALGYSGVEVDAPAGQDHLTLRPPQPDLYPPHSYRNVLFMPQPRVAEVTTILTAP